MLASIQGKIVAVTGANGMVGAVMIETLIAIGAKVFAAGKGACRLASTLQEQIVYSEVDLLQPQALLNWVKGCNPDWLLHLGAITQPDEAALDPIRCWRVNVQASQWLAQAALEVGAKMVLLSTDFVFSGESGPYQESDITGPVNYYGLSKLRAEKAVMATLPDALVIRTVLVYGLVSPGGRPNIVSWVANAYREQRAIKVVTDQWRTPTFTPDLVNAILQLMAANAVGLYHVSGAEGASPFVIACKVVEQLGGDWRQLITPVDAASFQQPAQRPLITGFILDKLMQKIDFQPTGIEKSIAAILAYLPK